MPPIRLDKPALLDALRLRLHDNAAALRRAHEQAKGAATHVEARAEGPKDMRSTEASYLARGLAERAESARVDALKFDAFEAPPFEADASVALGACVVLEDEGGQRAHYLLVPAGGGEKLELEGVEVRALTLQAPLSQQLLGCTVGDEVKQAGRVLDLVDIF